MNAHKLFLPQPTEASGFLWQTTFKTPFALTVKLARGGDLGMTYCGASSTPRLMSEIEMRVLPRDERSDVLRRATKSQHHEDVRVCRARVHLHSVVRRGEIIASEPGFENLLALFDNAACARFSSVGSGIRQRR